ncbi:uncharacterized protein EI90DRAFT_3282129 [Cantharellus anzutake]|uniref:uncharacterized protein n=1 Tax=Cantharellus anzutake TaxID=1750568 RepID=UPI001903A8C3|nr:uncharacterized protein EI90DRAFT_3282129 [Cantharellus anzutake]KAF8323540.1 hypothetical protein EI90DRAFT_3282129 [Cantharellus anzutake]
MGNSWRALATIAHEKLLRTPQLAPGEIFNLWCLRLSSLARMRLFNQAAAECTNLWAMLDSFHITDHSHDPINATVPFELWLLRARAKLWMNDAYGYLDELASLIRICKRRAKNPTVFGDPILWKDHACRIHLLIAGQLLDLEDFQGARKILNGLLSSTPLSETLILAAERTNFQSGHMESVQQSLNGGLSMNGLGSALRAIAEGRWGDAVTTLQALIAQDTGNLMAYNNLAVALLGSGQVEEATRTLEQALKTSPSAFLVAEPLIFNLATLYELRSSTASIKKHELLVEAARWSGDGIRGTCLKLSTS